MTPQQCEIIAGNLVWVWFSAKWQKAKVRGWLMKRGKYLASQRLPDIFCNLYFKYYDFLNGNLNLQKKLTKTNTKNKTFKCQWHNQTNRTNPVLLHIQTNQTAFLSLTGNGKDQKTQLQNPAILGAILGITSQEILPFINLILIYHLRVPKLCMLSAILYYCKRHFYDGRI